MKFTNLDENIVTLTFGKYKGESIEDVPNDYLLFMANKFDKGSLFQKIADDEIKNRDLSARNVKLTFGKYAGTEIHYICDEYLIYLVDTMEADNPIFDFIIEELTERGVDF